MTLRISPELALPVDVAGEAIAILAKRGAGKTNTATVLVEELHAAAVQVVVLDPVGAWWGLRSSADGGKGLPIPILGGEHGDVPLEPTAGAVIADVVVDSGQSLLLDLSDFPSKSAHARFVVDFGERLFRRKARDRTLVHLVLEEADAFVPQTKAADVARMKGAVEAIVRRGRSRGLGVTLITQRSAVLDKDVLTQTDVLIVMRTTGPHDQRAIREWVAARGDEHGESVIESLPGLATGEAWIWNPERDLLDRVKIRPRHTFDSSSTPKAGETRLAPKQAAPIDLEQLGEQIAATAERAKDNDPAELRKQIRELQRQVAQRPAAPKEVEKVVEVPVLNGQVGELTAAVDAMRDVAARLVDVGAKVEKSADAIASAIARVGAAPPRPRAQGERKAVRPTRRAAPTESPPDDGVALSGSQQRVLNALAWFEWVGIASPSRPAVAFVAGTRPTSGGFKNNLGALRSAGLLEYPAANRVQLTDAGRARSVPPSEAPTAEALQEAALGAVTGSQAAILRALIDAYPEPLSREDLADAVGTPVTSGGFKNNLGALRTLELVDYPVPGAVVALPVLFMEGA